MASAINCFFLFPSPYLLSYFYLIKCGCYIPMFKWPLVNRIVPTSRATNDTFVLYKRISEQYDNHDILNYVRNLMPVEIVSETEVRDKDEPLKSVLQWFKRDFMRWTPKDPKCEKCNTPMSSQFIKGNSWKFRKLRGCLMCQKISLERICSYNSKPFISGILISRIRRSYLFPPLKEERAIKGSVNLSTSNPLSCKPKVKIEALSNSSSTTKILFSLSLFIF